MNESEKKNWVGLEKSQENQENSSLVNEWIRKISQQKEPDPQEKPDSTYVSLLTENIRPVDRGENSFTPLMAAARFGKPKIFYNLLRFKLPQSDILYAMIPDNDGMNIIHHAVMGDNLQILQHILDFAEANPEQWKTTSFSEILNETNCFGETPFDLSLRHKKSLEVVSFLKQRGAIINNHGILLKEFIERKEILPIFLGKNINLADEPTLAKKSAEAVNKIVENFGKMAEKRKDGGVEILSILEALKEQNVQNILNKNNTIIAATLLENKEEIIENYNSRECREEQVITDLEKLKIDNIKRLGREIFTRSDSQTHHIIAPETLALIAMVNLLESEVFNTKTRSSDFVNADMTDAQLRLVNSLIEEFSPLGIVKYSNSAASLKKDNNKEIKL